MLGRQVAEGQASAAANSKLIENLKGAINKMKVREAVNKSAAGSEQDALRTELEEAKAQLLQKQQELTGAESLMIDLRKELQWLEQQAQGISAAPQEQEESKQLRSRVRTAEARAAELQRDLQQKVQEAGVLSKQLKAASAGKAKAEKAYKELQGWQPVQGSAAAGAEAALQARLEKMQGERDAAVQRAQQEKAQRQAAEKDAQEAKSSAVQLVSEKEVMLRQLAGMRAAMGSMQVAQAGILGGPRGPHGAQLPGVYPPGYPWPAPPGYR